MGNPPAQTEQLFDNGANAYEASTGGCTRDLARHMLALSPPLPSGSVVHDNACGTGIVAREIVARDILAQQSPNSNYTLRIHCTDKSEKMIQLAQSCFEDSQFATNMQTTFSGVNVDFKTMPSEGLAFEDQYFTHSFTNCGILWFDDGSAGAREILRTLKHGGTAVVTSWKEMKIFDVVREAQRKCGQQEPLFRPPVDEKWFGAEYLGNVLREAGFDHVEVVERMVHFAGKDISDLCDRLMGLLRQLKQEWEGDEYRIFREQLEIAANKVAVRFERPAAEGMEKFSGIPMIALAAVAQKR